MIPVSAFPEPVKKYLQLQTEHQNLHNAYRIKYKECKDLQEKFKVMELLEGIPNSTLLMNFTPQEAAIYGPSGKLRVRETLKGGSRPSKVEMQQAMEVWITNFMTTVPLSPADKQKWCSKELSNMASKSCTDFVFSKLPRTVVKEIVRTQTGLKRKRAAKALTTTQLEGMAAAENRLQRRPRKAKRTVLDH